VAQSNVVTVTGAATVDPASSALFVPSSLSQFLSLNLEVTYGSAKGMERTTTGTVGSPDTLPLEGITKARFLAIRLLSGASLQVWITTALGLAKIPVSDEFVWHAPNPGDEATLIQLAQAGSSVDFQYVLAGDLT
jgi:hypothetical protein